MRVSYLLLIFFSFSVWGQIVINPSKQDQTVHPGDIANAYIKILDEALINQLGPENIKKLGSSKTFLVMTLSPLEKNASGWQHTARIVFGPEFSPDINYELAVPGKTVEVSFKGWMWNPQAQQVSPEYDYENVPLFSRSWFQKNLILVMVASLAFFAVAGYIFRAWKKKLAEKKARENEIKQWRHKIESAKSILEFSVLWSSRDELIGVFPSARPELRRFFDRLNQSQFKPSISSEELESLKKEKEQLLRKINQVKHGV